MTTTVFGSNTGDTGGAIAIAQMQESDPTTPNADPNIMEAHRFGVGDTGDWVMLIAAIAATIPAGSTINSVMFEAYLDSSVNADAAYEVRLFPLLVDFVDTQCTFDDRKTATAWTGGGGTGNGTDRNATHLSALVIGNSATGSYYAWNTSAAFVAYIQGIVDGGTDFGIQVEATTAAAGTTRQWGAGTSYTDGFRPKLTVDWTEASVQLSSPASDVSDGTWIASDGSGNLFSMIDESSADDADYIYTITAADQCEVALASLTDPVSSTGHKVRYRIRGDGVSGITVTLRQGTGTTIASWTHDPAPVDWTTVEQTLSAGEANSISNYADLRLRFTEV